MKQIAVGINVVWALDSNGKISVRREIQSNIFPEGTFWQTLPALTNDPIHIGKLNFSVPLEFGKFHLLKRNLFLNTFFDLFATGVDTEISIPSSIRNLPSELLRCS